MNLDSINEHSPWWARIVAIMVGFIVLGSFISVFYLEIFGINGINQYTFEKPENPGEYPENGTEEKQMWYNISLQEWNDYQSYQEMMDELEESYATEVSQAFAILTVIIGIPTVVMLWTRHEKMLHFGITFGSVKAIGDLWASYISSDIVARYMESIPGGGDYSWIARTSIFTSTFCGIFLIAITIVMANMYHSSREIPNSGFHVNLDKQEEE